MLRIIWGWLDSRKIRRGTGCGNYMVGPSAMHDHMCSSSASPERNGERKRGSIALALVCPLGVCVAERFAAFWKSPAGSDWCRKRVIVHDQAGRLLSEENVYPFGFCCLQSYFTASGLQYMDLLQLLSEGQLALRLWGSMVVG